MHDKRPENEQRRPMKDFAVVTWDERLAADCRDLVRLAIREDLDRTYDWTTVALVPEGTTATARIVARQSGVIAGLPAARLALAEYDDTATFTQHREDGARVERGDCVATISGSARTLLTAERVLLNFLGRLSGVASLTRRYCDAVSDTKARIYDTRKTTPGWRRLEKYAVHIGGGHNHRSGLYDAVLIKDNHLAFGAAENAAACYSPAEAVQRVRDFLRESSLGVQWSSLIIEVEVDSLEQLAAVLPVCPDIVLLDNMSPAALTSAVAQRDAIAPSVELEASGGVMLDTVAAIAQTGVDRISSGALTHSAVNFDVALDWGLA
jgi:nicotinate-nucleotide pyrophosphorylase (carboxylating)